MCTNVWFVDCCDTYMNIFYSIFIVYSTILASDLKQKLNESWDFTKERQEQIVSTDLKFYAKFELQQEAWTDTSTHNYYSIRMLFGVCRTLRNVPWKFERAYGSDFHSRQPTRSDNKLKSVFMPNKTIICVVHQRTFNCAVQQLSSDVIMTFVRQLFCWTVLTVWNSTAVSCSKGCIFITWKTKSQFRKIRAAIFNGAIFSAVSQRVSFLTRAECTSAI